MKKYLLTMVMCFAVCMCAMAGSNIKVTQGDKKIFKTASGNAVVEFVWDGATYDNKQPLTEKYNNLEELKPIAWKGFQNAFNKSCKKVKVVEDAADATYKFTIKVTNMDQYFKVMGFVPGNATKAWGTLTITDVKSGQVLVEGTFSGIDGGANLSPDGTFEDCFEEVARQVARLK